MPSLSSASGLLALLSEPDVDLQSHALRALDGLVDSFWAEISQSIPQIESLYEDESFASRKLAALVASKVYYHLGELSEAMDFALGAADLFDVSKGSQYVDTILSRCVDEYIRLRNKKTAADEPAVSIDKRLETMVERMFAHCFESNEIREAIGVALESRRLDIVREALHRNQKSAAAESFDALKYVFDVASKGVGSLDFRLDVLRLLVSEYSSLAQPDYFAVAQCYTLLNEAAPTAAMLQSLVSNESAEQHVIAYQIAFDLADNASQFFVQSVLQSLPLVPDLPPTPASADPSVAAAAAANEELSLDGRMRKIRRILSGIVSISLNLDFLCRSNHTDTLLLKNLKTATEGRSSVLHSATITANSFMHAGTTIDLFLRENIEWLARATNWAKFSAAASLGVIHKGSIQDSRNILAQYLPSGLNGVPQAAGGGGGGPYSEGGALYALGLIHANHGSDIVPLLLQAIRNDPSGRRPPPSDTVLHGACLGLGLAAMATSNAEVVEELKRVLFTDSAVAGEAAGLALGLVLAGSISDPSIHEVLAYAHDTQHEKIIRGVAMGLAIAAYGREDQADGLIEQLVRDKDPLLRYGGMFAIGLAYAGTANNAAVRRLLHVAVSDVADDVRRAAVMNLGFLLARNPDQCPRLVGLLAKSFNPHVRYGATLAVGLSCAGTGLREAVELLEPLQTDPVNFVRQGAMIALAMVLVQQNEHTEPKVLAFRKHIEKITTERHEDVMTKMGAVLAHGLLDAGGRNVTISCLGAGSSQQLNMPATIGLAVFAQYWFWYPLQHFAALAFQPTALICLNKDLKMPQLTVRSNARPSLFSYPPMTQPPQKEEVAQVTAVLSTTVRAAKRSAAKEKEKEQRGSASNTPSEPSGMAIDSTPSQPEPSSSQPESSSAAVSSSTPTKEKKEKKVKEPAFEDLQNPLRVTFGQRKHIAFSAGQRYTPVAAGRTTGIVLLKDLQPESEVQYVKPAQAASAASASSGAAAAEAEGEPSPPEAFSWP